MSAISRLFDQVEKRNTAEHERVERLIANMERLMQKAFLQFVANVQSPDVMKEVGDFLERNDIESALRIVDRYIARMAPVVSDIFQRAARDETASLEGKAKAIAPAVGISFDPTYQRAADIMRRRTLDLISRFSQDQRKTVREALAEGLERGAGPRDVARVFRSAVGLTPSQDRAVRNYRRLLTIGSREALDRDLRDRRTDPSVERFANGGKPLTPKQIDDMVEGYRRRYVVYRSEVIARTETGSVVSAARYEALQQTLEDTGIPDSQVEREWRWTKDDRTRDSHRHMRVFKVTGMTSHFITGAGVPMLRPHDPDAPAEEVIQCRCLEIFRFIRPERLAA